MSKLWLWKNFVDGKPEYWAFDNLYPIHPNGDPMVLGDPVGYAIFKESIPGSKAYDAAIAGEGKADPTCRHGKPLHQDCIICEETGSDR